MSEAPCCALGHGGDQMCKVPAVTELTLQCHGKGWVADSEQIHTPCGKWGYLHKEIKQAQGTEGDGYGGRGCFWHSD